MLKSGVSPPASYDSGQHRAYCEKLDYIEFKVLPKFVVGDEHLVNCRKINLGLLADGQPMPAITSEGAQIPFIPGAGNVFAYGVPGTGKTLIGMIFGAIYGMPYRRIQFTADLLPADLTGSRIFNQERGVYEIVGGPLVKARFVLGDELPRSTPKTQSALLQVMEGWTITICHETHQVDPGKEVFFVFATGNPIETESGGVFELGAAVLDRFGQVLSFNYLNQAGDIVKLIETLEKYAEPQTRVQQIMSMQELVTMRDFRRKNVVISEGAKKYIERLTYAMRQPQNEEEFFEDLEGYNPQDKIRLIQLGPSDRSAGAFLANFAKAYAFRQKRCLADEEDVRMIAVDCLSHRLRLTQECGSIFRTHHRNTITEFQFQQLIMTKILEHVPIFASRGK